MKNNKEKDAIKNRLNACMDTWCETNSRFPTIMSKSNITISNNPNDYHMEEFFINNALLWEKIFGIVPANPSDSNRTDYLKKTSIKGNIYRQIDRTLSEQNGRSENSISIISARRGAGKSTAQNLWINLNSHTYEKTHKRILVRWNAHKVQYMFKELMKTSITPPNFTVHEYISIQLVYIVIKYGGNSNATRTTLHDFYDHLVKTGGPIKNHGLNNAQIKTTEDFLAHFKKEIADNDKGKSHTYDDSIHNDLWMNPLLKLVMSISKMKSSYLKDTFNQIQEIAAKIYTHIRENNYRLIVFMDGIDNMSWHSKQPGFQGKGKFTHDVLHQSYVVMLDSILDYIGSPSSITNTPTDVLLFCRPESIEHLLRDSSAPKRTGNRKKHPAFITVSEQFSFVDLFDKKVALLNQDHQYFINKKNRLLDSYKTIEVANKDNAQAKGSIHSPRGHVIDEKLIKSYKTSYLSYIDIKWHNHIIVLLNTLRDMQGLTKNTEKSFTIEDVGYENFRALTFNSIAVANKIIRSNPTVFLNLVEGEEEYVRGEYVDISYGDRSISVDKYVTQDTRLARLIRRGLVAFSTDITLREPYEDIRGALIPSLFRYDASILQSCQLSQIIRKRWGGLINIRIIQLLNSNSPTGITQKETVEKISALFEWPTPLVTDCFNRLVEYGLVEPTEESQRQMLENVSQEALHFVPTIKAEISIRLAFGYADIATLMVIETPVSDSFDGFADQYKSGQFKDFLKAMVVCYIALIKHVFIQRTIEEKYLRNNVKNYLTTISGEAPNKRIISDEEIQEECSLFDLPDTLIIQRHALDGITGALNTIKSRISKNAYNQVIDKLSQIGIDLSELD